MRQMKESGIEWIGKIPETWEVHPALYFFSEIRDKNTDGSIKKALKFYNGTIVPKTDFNDNSDDYVVDTIANYTVVEPNTIMINGLNLNFDLKSLRVGLVTEMGVITSAYLAVWPDVSRIDPRYATYLLKGYDSVKAFHNMGVGIRKTLGFNEFKKQPILYPDLETQKRIVAFLDSECSQIDSIIEKQEAIIEKLKEYKLSVITEAVTKGLDPNVEMKDSGIAWIGSIPSGWLVKSLGSVSLDIRNGYVGPTRDILVDDGVPYIQSLHVKDGIISFEKARYFVTEEWGNKHPKVYEGQIVIVQTGDIGQVGLVTSDMNGFNCHALIIVTLDRKLLFPRYLQYYLRSKPGKELMLNTSTGALLPHLNSGKVKGTSVLMPSVEEQINIASFLDNQCKSIDETISIKMSVIEKMKDYKKSIIYEVVTGKKEV